MTEITRDRNAYSFQAEVRVRLVETDAVGIVFFGSYATYMDVGRMDYLNNLGLTRLDGPVRDLAPGAVVHSESNFHSPARYNDVLVVNTRVAALGASSYTFHFLINLKQRPKEVTATGVLKLVWLDEAFRPIALPAEFRSAIEAFEGDSLS